jgi:carbon monoxide dehydrogenase subunit G
VELTHRFTVPGSVEETWARFQDIGSLAECFPGAQVTSAEGDTFDGTVKVKLGPIALVYAGSGSFVAKDEAAHTFLVEAKGRDKRGNGTAGANVTVDMEAEGDGTSVEVKTDLAITGKPAQFGRGVMQDVSDKLLGQFVTCLEQKIAAEHGGGDAATEEAPAEEQPAAAAPRHAAPTAQPASSGTSSSAAGDDAIDLGGAVLPVLLKHYGKYAAGGLVVVLLLWLLGRRRGR